MRVFLGPDDRKIAAKKKEQPSLKSSEQEKGRSGAYIASSFHLVKNERVVLVIVILKINNINNKMGGGADEWTVRRN